MDKYVERSDGTSEYMTRDGDMIDMIAFAFYGHHERTTEVICEANPGLAGVHQPFEAGRFIILPKRFAAPASAQIELWD